MCVDECFNGNLNFRNQESKKREFLAIYFWTENKNRKTDRGAQLGFRLLAQVDCLVFL
jgi:hypothetical protein